MRDFEYEYLNRYLKDGEENVLEFINGYIWLTFNSSPAFNYVFYNPTFNSIISVYKSLPPFNSENSTLEFRIVYYERIKRRFHRAEIRKIYGEKKCMSLELLCISLLKEDDICFEYNEYEFYTYLEDNKKNVCFSKSYETRQELYNEFIKY